MNITTAIQTFILHQQQQQATSPSSREGRRTEPSIGEPRHMAWPPSLGNFQFNVIL
jgi:hypothetical protein